MLRRNYGIDKSDAALGDPAGAGEIDRRCAVAMPPPQEPRELGYARFRSIALQAEIRLGSRRR